MTYQVNAKNLYSELKNNTVKDNIVIKIKKALQIYTSQVKVDS